MTTAEILHALRETAMGRANTVYQVELAEKLSALFAKNACEFCTMPGGKHYGPCPKNPERDQFTDIYKTEAPSEPAKRTRKAKAE